MVNWETEKRETIKWETAIGKNGNRNYAIE